MSVYFFGTECTEPSRTDDVFGICDGQDGGKAYSNTTDKNKWIAVVKNSKGLSIQEQYFPLLQESVAVGESPAWHSAMLEVNNMMGCKSF